MSDMQKSIRRDNGEKIHLEQNPECEEVPQMENSKTDVKTVAETSETQAR